MIDFTKKPDDEWIMRPHYHIEIISFKELKNGEDKFDVWQNEAETLQDATRIVNTFKPKKGYTPLTYRIDFTKTLFDYE